MIFFSDNLKDGNSEGKPDSTNEGINENDERKPGRRGGWHPARDEQSRWRKLRKRMMRANPYCVTCRQAGALRTASVLDHITPIEERGHPWDSKNLQLLCRECHQAKTATEAAERRARTGKNNALVVCQHGYHLAGDFACPECAHD